MKILVINFGAASDIIYSTPLIRCLKVQGDVSLLHYATDAQGTMLLSENPYLDSAFILDNSFGPLRALHKTHHYDVVINLISSPFASIATLFMGATVLTARNNFIHVWLMSKLKINKLRNEHCTDQLLSLLSSLNISPDYLGLDYFVPENDDVPLAWLPHFFKKEFVAFYIQAPYGTRKLPVKRMIELCDKINKPIILLGDKEDIDTGDIISKFFERNATSTQFEEGLKALNKKTIVYNACGNLIFINVQVL